jgi:hypothetical protein
MAALHSRHDIRLRHSIADYTGKNPVEELKPIERHVSGLCAKDCGALKGDVMIQFGRLKTAGLAGFISPVMFAEPHDASCASIHGRTIDSRRPRRLSFVRGDTAVTTDGSVRSICPRVLGHLQFRVSTPRTIESSPSSQGRHLVQSARRWQRDLHGSEYWRTRAAVFTVRSFTCIA